MPPEGRWNRITWLRAVGGSALAGALIFGLLRSGGTDDRALYGMALVMAVGTLAALASPTLRGRSGVVLLVLGLGVLSAATLLPSLQARGYVLLGLGWMTVFVTLTIARRNRWTSLWLGLLLAIGVAEGVYGIARMVLEPGSPATGTLVNRNHYAGLLNMILPIAVALVVLPPPTAGLARARLPAAVGLLATAPMAAGVLLSGSRGGVVALLATMTVLAWLARSAGRRALWVPVMVGLAVVAGVLHGGGRVSERFAELDEEVRRPRLHADSIRLLADHPIRGVGPGMYRWEFRRYQTIDTHKRVDHAHNDYLQTASEWGLPLAVLFWVFVLRRFLGAARVARAGSTVWRRRAALAGAAGIGSILLHSLVDFNLQIPSNTMVFASLLGVTWSLERNTRAPRVVLGRDALRRIGGGLLALVLVLFCWTTSRRWMALEMGEAATDLPGLERALAWDRSEPHLHYRLARAERDQLGGPRLARAESHLREALRLNPGNWKYWRDLGQLLELADRDSEAREAFLQALEVDPRSASLQWQIGQFELRSSGLDAAREHLRAALWAEPRLRPPGLDLLRAVGAPPEEIEQIWPAEPEARLYLLTELLEPGAEPGWRTLKARLWESLLTEDEPPAIDRAAPYVLELMAEGDAGAAHRAWVDLNRRHGRRDADFEGGNRIWNGDFELGLVDVSPGWRTARGASALEVVAGGGHRSGRAVRVRFEPGDSPDARRLDQRVVVAPGRWRVSAAARGEGVGPGCAPHLVVVGLSPRRRLAELPLPLAETWGEAAITFTSGESDRELIVRLVTPADCRSGRLWLDAIAVRPEVDSAS